MSKSCACATFQVFLRILAILASLAATILMVTSKQTTFIFGIALRAQYDYCIAFKFFAYANGIACGLSVLAVIVAFFACARGFRASDCFFLPTLDLVAMSLVMAGFAAAAAIGYVGKYGETHVGWSPICENVSRFCNQVTMAVATSLVAFVSLMLLAIMAASRV